MITFDSLSGSQHRPWGEQIVKRTIIFEFDQNYGVDDAADLKDEKTLLNVK